MTIYHRLFFALLPPVAPRGIIGRFRDGMADLRHPVTDGRLHLTLGITADHVASADLPTDTLKRIGEAVQEVPVDMVLDRITASRTSVAIRPSRRPDRLHDLADAIGALLRRLGLMRPGWRFNPHVTLGYRDGEPFNHAVAPIAWRADELILVHSHAGRTRHDLVGRWPLHCRQGDLFD